MMESNALPVHDEIEVMPQATQIVRAPIQDLMLTPVFDLETAQRRLAELQKFVEFYMVEGEDFGKIPGTPKPTLYKSGADKLCDIYALADTYKLTNRTEDWDRNLFDYEVECTLLSKRTGQLVASGLGSCNSYEGKYRWRETKRKCPQCGKETIIKGKEEYGGGWLCWRKEGKSDGCGAKFTIGDPSIVDQIVGKTQNDDIPTLKNTILKMAKKRAKVDAVLSATRSSGLFTQDIEEGGIAEPCQKNEDPYHKESVTSVRRDSRPGSSLSDSAPRNATQNAERGKQVSVQTTGNAESPRQQSEQLENSKSASTYSTRDTTSSEPSVQPVHATSLHTETEVHQFASRSKPDTRERMENSPSSKNQTQVGLTNSQLSSMGEKSPTSQDCTVILTNRGNSFVVITGDGLAVILSKLYETEKTLLGLAYDGNFWTVPIANAFRFADACVKHGVGVVHMDSGAARTSAPNGRVHPEPVHREGGAQPSPASPSRILKGVFVKTGQYGPKSPKNGQKWELRQVVWGDSRYATFNKDWWPLLEAGKGKPAILSVVEPTEKGKDGLIDGILRIGDTEYEIIEGKTVPVLQRA